MPAKTYAEPKTCNDTADSLYGRVWREVTDALLATMEARQVGYSHLAERLQWPRDRVAGVFCGTYDPTLGEVSQMAAALGLDLHVRMEKKG
jgi:DNA-binding phage protein